MSQERFHYKTLEEVKERAEELKVYLPFSSSTDILKTPLKVGNVTFHNRMGIAPMEGADSLEDGSPSDYTIRRYVNEAIGGSALIWFEAISIVPEGRSSKTQLLLTEENVESYKRMNEKIKEAGRKANGFEPYLIMQANHSGRYSNPDNRPGQYGGNYENRTRLLKNGIKAAKVWEDENFQVTCRLGIYDGYEYPWGFGVSEGSGLKPDLKEPIRLVKELYGNCGIQMMNLTMGNPYATTHVTRPFDMGKYEPEEHPFTGIGRMIAGIGEVKKAVPEMVIFGSAPTYLRQFADLYTAGAVEEGFCDGMLFGRMAFADPDYANEIIKNGRIDPKRVCMTCGKCGDLIRAHKPTGCVIRDPKTFMPFYKEFLEIKKKQPANFRG